jgi:hypothetical protein
MCRTKESFAVLHFEPAGRGWIPLLPKQSIPSRGDEGPAHFLTDLTAFGRDLIDEATDH